MFVMLNSPCIKNITWKWTHNFCCSIFNKKENHSKQLSWFFLWKLDIYHVFAPANTCRDSCNLKNNTVANLICSHWTTTDIILINRHLHLAYLMNSWWLSASRSRLNWNNTSDLNLWIDFNLQILRNLFVDSVYRIKYDAYGFFLVK